MNREDLLKKILKKIMTKRIDALFLDRFKLDFSANIRYDYIDNKKILLIYDVPIAKEMVQPYSDGMHYKPKDAIENIFVEYSPIALSHPDKNFEDMEESEIKELTIGYLNDGYFKNDKKYCNLYFFVDKIPKELIERIEDQKSIDVSIGFDVELDEKSGSFNGQHYDKIQKKITLDHLGVLLHEIGRASFPQGVGIGADSKKNKTEVSNMAENNKELVDALKEASEVKTKLSDAESKIKDHEKTIKDLEDKNAILEEQVKTENIKDLKEKAEKFDVLTEKKTKEDAEKVKEIKDKILKERDDDKMKEFIKDIDDVEKLQFILDEQMSSVKGVPAAKKKDKKKDVKDDPADAYQNKKYEKANEQEAL